MASDVFGSVIVPSVEQVPLLEITQDVRTDDMVLKASYEIEQTVLTAFDQSLSKHLAATKGQGFPSLSLTIRITDPETGKNWSPVTRQYFHALPHALTRVAEFALGDRERCEAMVFARSRSQAGDNAFGKAEVLTRAKIDSLKAAIQFCDMLGEYAFLHISGNFTSMVVQPSDRELGAIVIDLDRGTLGFPGEGGNPGLTCALFNPTRQISQSREASSYLTRMHHNLSIAKEQAIWDFRAAAEERIFGFDKALGGQPLTDYRMTAAETLVLRLRTGLGDNLLGLSEQAQITALGWASLVRRAKERSTMIEDKTASNDGEGKKSGSPIRLISVD